MQSVWDKFCEIILYLQIGTAMHEMMHALGIFHEQSRGDRDKFVRVRWENIIRGKKIYMFMRWGNLVIYFNIIS
jgi:hypothetical protein